MLSLIVSFVLAAATDPSASPQPQTKTPQPASAASQAAPDPNKVVCRVTDNIGSRIQGRTCKTQAQWDADEEAIRHFMSDVRAKTTLTNNSPGASGH